MCCVIVYSNQLLVGSSYTVISYHNKAQPPDVACKNVYGTCISWLVLFVSSVAVHPCTGLRPFSTPCTPSTRRPTSQAALVSDKDCNPVGKTKKMWGSNNGHLKTGFIGISVVCYRKLNSTCYPFELCNSKCRFSTDRIKQRSIV